jgi:hypothetical protein
MQTINLGTDAVSMLYSSCLLEYLIANDKAPKLVIMNIDLFEIMEGAWNGNFYRGIEKLAPLYGKVPYIDDALKKGSLFETIKYRTHSYKYNGLLLSMVSQLLKKRDKYRRGHSTTATLKLPIREKKMKEWFSEDRNIDSRKIDLLNSFIKRCQRSGIRIVLVETPKFHPELKMTERDRYLESRIESIASKQDIPFIKFTQDTMPEFKNHQLFKDVIHLNHTGSIRLSEILCEKLNKMNLNLAKNSSDT